MCSSKALLTILLTVVPHSLSALAHIVLAQPPRIGQVNNSPVDGPNSAGGGSYPCKYNGKPSFYANPIRTTIPLGSNYTVKFTGSAVHGGGSCQFSLSKDLAPSASSVFKVIYSIQGGCPARNTPGNLGNDASMPVPFDYPFTMPPELEPGQYTFAWTWINKVGNREFYMNCAAVDVTATGEHQGNSGYYETLPDLTVANVNGVDCVSEPDNGKGSFKYQKPGQFMETNEALQTVEKQCFAPIAAGTASQGPPLSGTQTSQLANIASSNGASQPTGQGGVGSAASPASTTIQQAVSPGVFVTKSSTSSLPSGFSTIATSSAKSAEPSSVSKSANCPSTWQSCTATGFFCVDKTHFGLCSFGCMPLVQSLAPGVGCNMTTNTLYDLRLEASMG